jgi:hypothetical protein
MLTHSAKKYLGLGHCKGAISMKNNTCSTTLLAITGNGQVKLTTEDEVVIHKAKIAKQNGVVKSFLYWTGSEVEIVKGHVTWILVKPTFRFAVNPGNS